MRDLSGRRVLLAVFVTALVGTITTAVAPTDPVSGVGGNPDVAGQPVNFGDAGFFGSMGGIALNGSVVGMAATPDGQGYWLGASDGGVFGFGDARFLGSMGGVRLNAPVVGIAPTPDGGGYWLASSDGGVFAFGDARFLGSMGGTRLNQAVVGIGCDRATGGYWLVAADGGVFGFGAPFFGSMGSQRLNSPVRGLAPNPSGGGYWLVASDGGVFAFGDSRFVGSMGGVPLNGSVVGMAATPDGQGYWLVAEDGGIFAFGNAPFLGSMASQSLTNPVAAIAATPDGGGYWLLPTARPPVSRLFGRIWTQIPTSAHEVAIAFDGGAGAGGVPSILSTLQNTGATATFFITGVFAQTFPGLAAQMANPAYRLGDHSFDHPHFTALSDAQVRSEVVDGASAIRSATGEDPAPLFRFPYGDSDARTLGIVNSLGYVAVGWTVDTLGWEGTSAGITVSSIVARVMANLRPGEIVLMHVGANPNDHSTLDADALPSVISAVRNAGYTFVNLNALLD